MSAMLVCSGSPDVDNLSDSPVPDTICIWVCSEIDESSLQLAVEVTVIS